MKKIYFILLSSFICLHTFAQQFNFSDSTKVSMLICSPGEEVYALFGHAGIRVKDTQNKLDVVFNYGIFDFETNNFYYKFIKGETDYTLGINQTAIFLDEYAQRKSNVWEQNLNLNKNEIKNLINLLLNDYKPENRVYRYNFIYENCATRPRDRVLSSIDGFIKFKPTIESRTFRTWINNYTFKYPWVNFGINLIFGMNADKIATPHETMFLPELILSEFENIIMIKNDSIVKESNLVSEKNILINNSMNDIVEKSIVNEPIFIFAIILLIALLITFLEVKFHHYAFVFDSLLLIISGIVGIIIFYLMFISLHPMVKNNLNLLIFNPLNIFAAVLIGFKKLRLSLFIYYIVNISLILIALILFTLSFQSFDVSIFIIMIIFVVRYLSFIFNSNQKPIINKLTK